MTISTRHFGKILGTGLLVSTALVGPAIQAAPSRAADLILTDARVYTVESDHPWAQAVAVSDGRIVAVGTTAQMARWKGANTRTIDLHGKLLMPAFGDAHAHPLFGGISYSRCSLHAGNSVEDYKRIIAGCVAGTPGKGTIFGVGWRDGLFPPKGIPSKAILDAISSDRALIFRSTGGHSLWVNSKALANAGITKDTPDPKNGRIDRDPATGEAIGGLEEDAGMALMDPQIPAPSSKDIQDAILYTAHTFNAWGITSWHDALVEVQPDGTSPVLEAYNVVRNDGALSAHTVIDLKWDDLRGLEQLPPLLKAAQWGRDHGLRTNSVKIFLDGVIPQDTAAMLEPYEGTTDRGSLEISETALKQAIQALDARNMQVHIHAIGDRAVRVALDAFEAAEQANGLRDNRHMISHLNVVDPADQPRFAKLNVTAIFQPYWASYEPYMNLAIARIGPVRERYIYPQGNIMRDGGRVAYGSDWPVASADPLLGIQVALTRIDPAHPENRPLGPEQRITLPEAVRNYTLNVAYVNHLEQETGSIRVGKSADLIVLDKDIFTLPPQQISTTKVLVTLFKGRPVFGSLEDATR
jgi:predicted amidohydrolase YtcJ